MTVASSATNLRSEYDVASKVGTAVWACVVAMIVLMLAMLALPASLVGASTHDFVALLDGAYRIERGLVPHIDFSVPHGPVPVYQAWIALRLAGYTPPFYLVSASSFLLLLFPAIQIALKQPGWVKASVVILTTAALCFFPFLLLNDYLSGPEHAGIHNRVSSAVIFLVFVFVLTPKKVTWIGAATLAYLLILLFGFKITSALVGLAVCCAAAIVSAPARAILLRATVIFLFLLLAINVYHGIVGGYLHDVSQLMSVNKNSLAGRAFKQVLVCAVPLSIGVVVCLIQARSSGLFNDRPFLMKRPVTQLRRLRPLLMVITILAATALNESQNSGNVGLFVASSLAFYRFQRRHNQPLVAIANAVLVTAAVTPWLQVATQGTATALYHSRHVKRTAAISAIYPGGGTNQRDMAAAVDFWAVTKALLKAPQNVQEAVAVQLADRLGSAASFIVLAQTVGEITKIARADPRITSQSRVESLTEVQFFDRILGSLPGENSNLWLDTARTVDVSSPDFARRFLRSLDFLLVPLCHFTPGERVLGEKIMPAVEEFFSLEAGTDCWQIWRRR